MEDHHDSLLSHLRVAYSNTSDVIHSISRRYTTQYSPYISEDFALTLQSDQTLTVRVSMSSRISPRNTFCDTQQFNINYYVWQVANIYAILSINQFSRTLQSSGMPKYDHVVINRS